MTAFCAPPADSKMPVPLPSSAVFRFQSDHARGMALLVGELSAHAREEGWLVAANSLPQLELEFRPQLTSTKPASPAP
jgi:hypothetical protein